MTRPAADGALSPWRAGVLLHFTVAYGAIAFFVMNLVVIPLTRIGRQPLVWSAFAVGGLIVHVLLLGPAAAYFARRAAGPGSRAA